MPSTTPSSTMSSTQPPTHDPIPLPRTPPRALLRRHTPTNTSKTTQTPDQKPIKTLHRLQIRPTMNPHPRPNPSPTSICSNSIPVPHPLDHLPPPSVPPTAIATWLQTWFRSYMQAQSQNKTRQHGYMKEVKAYISRLGLTAEQIHDMGEEALLGVLYAAFRGGGSGSMDESGTWEGLVMFPFEKLVVDIIEARERGVMVSVQQRQESWKERKAKEKGMWTVLGGVWAATPLALCRWV